MSKENDHIVVPPTVLQVMEEFIAVMRCDPHIPDDAISRLESLLLKGAAAKPDDINMALFEPPTEGEI